MQDFDGGTSNLSVGSFGLVDACIFSNVNIDAEPNSTVGGALVLVYTYGDLQNMTANPVTVEFRVKLDGVHSPVTTTVQLAAFGTGKWNLFVPLRPSAGLHTFSVEANASAMTSTSSAHMTLTILP